MELQLGLTLSNSSSSSNEGKFDLNNAIDENNNGVNVLLNKKKKRCRINGDDDDDDDYEDDEFSSNSTLLDCDDHHDNSTITTKLPALKQRKLLPLFVWNNNNYNNNNDDEDDNEDRKSCKELVEGEGNCIVGWPPIKCSWMNKKKQINNGNYDHSKKHYDIHDQDQGCVINVDTENCGGGSINKSKAMFVKVTMEGMPIGRKVDLSLYHSYETHHSYETLTTALLTMFGKLDDEQKNVNKGNSSDRHRIYKLTYQDKEGDWLLVGDVPWKSFIESVQRLKIIKNSI